MLTRTKSTIAWSVGLSVLVSAAVLSVARAQISEPDPNASPAECGDADTPETGIQGDVPRDDPESGRAELGYNCGLSLVGELETVSGAVQGHGTCAYVRGEEEIAVVDVSDPTSPVQVGSVPQIDRTETMRVMIVDDREILVDGTAVYDISNCLEPTLMGEIPYPGVLPWPADLNHDIRVTFDGKKVWGSIGVIEADISSSDPDDWTVENHTCAVAAQWHPMYAPTTAAGVDLCDPESPWQDWPPQIGHGPALNGDGSRLYMGNQTVVGSWYADENGPEDGAVRIIDTTQDPPEVISTFDGPGHSIDWFTIGEREYLLHANEIVTNPASSCVPHPRPSSLGWAFEAFITDITNGKEPQRASMIELAINKPENCEAKLDSNQNTQISYHTVNQFEDATFAMISMGDAGLRVFDIREPQDPTEVAYFNRGALVHAGIAHVDAERGLLYVPGADAFRVLEIQPQVLAALGLEEPRCPNYPLYPNGRAATPGPADKPAAPRSPTYCGPNETARNRIRH